MASMHYLTVQDILWINYQVTQKVQEFSYSKLEEATFYQYGYGTSKNTVSQAARFIEGFLKMSPLDAGNEATGFIGLAAFLQMNGYSLEVSDGEAADWLKGIGSGQSKANEAVEKAVKEAHGGHHALQPNVHNICEEIMERYPKTIATLMPASV